ncbi:MAG: tripartite tricarboxylate transporter substrate binding protein [Burkholderiales bacterium]|jgi:tripartite-type tricarboxylate transporter receptor subunit TctC|nr:tripartite tricarboxylate transporter substrate binding protein [Burkholderiales bacterium]
MSHPRNFLTGALALLVTAAAWVAPQEASAQSWPTKSIRLVVPYTAGGSSDFVARLMAQKLTEGLGQSVVVDNKPGVAGIVGTEIVAKSAPDGYTLALIGMTTHAANPSLYKTLPYDPVKDFAPISVAIVSPLVLVVNPAVPAKSVQELIAYAKAHPGTVNYGSAGVGNTLHLAGESFKAAAGIDIVHVPYKGASAAMNDLLGGRIQMMIDLVQTPLPHIQAGKLRALGVTSATRVPMLPDVPTIAESGLPGFEFATWIGIAAPAGTPKAIVDRIHAEMVKALAMPEVKEAFAKQGMVTAPSASPEAFARQIVAEKARIAALAKNIGIQPE